VKVARWIVAVTTGVLLLTLVLMPPERHLGRLLSLIYLHGALIRSGALLFFLSALASIWAFFTDKEEAWQWVVALFISAWLTWVLGFIISFYPSYVTWGAPIVWAEPRTRMVVNVALIAALFFTLAYWLHDRRWWGIVALLIGGALPILLWRTGVIRHPLNPVGTSPSTALRVAYTCVLISTFILGLTLAYYLKHHFHTLLRGEDRRP